MKISDLRSKSKEELRALLVQARSRIEETRLLVRRKKIKNVKEIRGLRRDIARILTFLRI